MSVQKFSDQTSSFIDCFLTEFQLNNDYEYSNKINNFNVFNEINDNCINDVNNTNKNLKSENSFPMPNNNDLNKKLKVLFEDCEPLLEQLIDLSFLDEEIKQENLKLNQKIECSYCKNLPDKQDNYKTHCLKDNQNRIICPVLRNYNCPICRNNGGDQAHTFNYCPKRECGFCKTLPYQQNKYKTHWLMDKKHRIICPILRNIKCPLCGNPGGDNAHTIKYCPLNQNQNFLAQKKLFVQFFNYFI